MSKFNIRQHLPPDVAEDQVDVIGKALLTERARDQKLSVTGEVERVYDEAVVGVALPDSEGKMAITHVPMSSPHAEGRNPDARVVEWQVDVEPITADPALPIIGVVHADSRTSSTHLPSTITSNGGMVAFRHNLHGEVTVTLYDAAGETVGYELAVEISPDEQQVQITVPGAHRIEAVLDDKDGA